MDVFYSCMSLECVTDCVPLDLIIDEDDEEEEGIVTKVKEDSVPLGEGSHPSDALEYLFRTIEKIDIFTDDSGAESDASVCSTNAVVPVTRSTVGYYDGEALHPMHY